MTDILPVIEVEELEVMRPARMLRRDDLPEPEGPRIAVRVPGSREP